jgi:hypothetical protein
VRVNTRRVFAVVELSALMLVLIVVGRVEISAADESRLWTPAPRPAECQALNAELLLLDVSGSMLRGNVFGRAVEQLSHYIGAAPHCSYVIVGKFGTTSDVVRDAFLVTDDDRKTLIEAVTALRATHHSTNLDEAAKAIEWIESKLRLAYAGRDVSLTVRVLSDEISAPDPGKPTFSLRRFFEESLANRDVNLSEITLTPSGVAEGQLPESKGYAQVTTPVDELAATLAHTSPKTEPIATASASPDAEIRRPIEETGLPFGDRYRVATVAAGLALFATVAILLVRSRDKTLAPVHSVDGDAQQPEGIDSLVALSVTERELTDRDGEPRTLRRGAIVPIAPDAAITIGPDPIRATYISPPLKGVTAEDFFRITAKHGQLHVKGAPGARTNDTPIPDKGVAHASDRPITLRLKDREWIVTPVSGRSGQQEQADALFSRLRNRRAADAAHQQEQQEEL